MQVVLLSKRKLKGKADWLGKLLSALANCMQDDTIPEAMPIDTVKSVIGIDVG